MKLSINWIRDFVNLDGIEIDTLIQKFTLATAEVEEIQHVGRDIQNVVVGKIVSMEKHPNSKKLHLLKVDGGDAIYDVVCGAPNVAVGIKVPFAKAGGQVGGMKIERRPVAGYESCGMCCSEKEIGISDDHSGLMILPEDSPVGTDIKKLYEIEDTIFEVDNKSLTNRPDLWGHYGIAREIAALAGRPLQEVQKVDTGAYESLPAVPIAAENQEHLLRYSAMAVENISVKISPVNMRIRLYRCGMRAINLLADLTNYIMLEMGQPMHAFDYQRVSQIEVGNFPQSIQFETLDGKVREVHPETLMIKSKGTPVAIAGIMGGYESEITEETTSFLLESANFDAVNVRKSSSYLGLRTDASMRYEKTLDPEMTIPAIQRYLSLLFSIDPGVRVISSLSDLYIRRYPKIQIEFDKAYVDRYTGIDISVGQIEDTLTRLGFGVERRGDAFTVQVPSWRATKDVSIKADIIEEITRIYGYDNFAIQTATCAVAPMAREPRKVLIDELKTLLALSYGSHEVHTYLWNDARKLKEIGLEAEGFVRLKNSVSPDIDLLRCDLTPALLCTVEKNRSYAPEFSIFEIGSVVAGIDKEGLAKEERRLSVVFYGRRTEEEALLMKAKGFVEGIASAFYNEKFSYYSMTEAPKPWMHPYNAFQISFGQTLLGLMGIVHPQVTDKIDKKASIIAVELNVDELSKIAKMLPQYREPSKFPSVTADLSYLIASEVPYSAFQSMVETLALPFLESYELVGIYQDPAWKKQKSVTIRFVFCSQERTLESEEVQALVNRLIEAGEKMGAQVKDN